MNPDYSKYLQDILDSIKMIDVHLTGISSFTEYASDITVIDAVERRLAIIGLSIVESV
ncbi:MAG: hypothetical protein ABIO55_14745 [Ginsengibacter sp.]